MGILPEKTARVFLDEGVEVLVGARERIERMYWCRRAIVGDCVVAEDFEDNFEWKIVDTGHGGGWVLSCAG